MRPLGRATRTRPYARWMWLFGGLTLVLAVSLAILVGTEFSASQTRASRENPDLPGIDVVGLDPEQLQLLLTRAKNEPCPCPCGFTLAGCRHKDTTCPRSGPILEGMVSEYRSQNRSAGRDE